jgi:hypothetical protein
MKKLLFILSFILVAFTSCENELVSAPPSDNIDDSSGDLVGSWNLTSLNYSGTNVVTSDSGVENQDVQGIASDYNYIMVFTESPSNYIITGSFDLEYTVTVNGESITENFDDISGASSGTWTKDANVFVTTESGSGEVLSSTIQILNDTTLKFTNVIIEEDNSTPDETSVSTITSEYIFEKI